jgi:hypothetical protein
MNLNPFKKKKAVEPVVEAAPVKVREHRGQGARKAARRKFRHTLQNKLAVELRATFPGISPKMARFQARIKADAVIAAGSTDANIHGRGLVR